MILAGFRGMDEVTLKGRWQLREWRWQKLVKSFQGQARIRGWSVAKEEEVSWVW